MDKRKSPRQKTFISAVIDFNERRSTMNGTIRNISKSGARLAIDGPHTLPSTFQMTLPERDRRHLAQVVWLAPDAMGVTFLSTSRV